MKLPTLLTLSRVPILFIIVGLLFINLPGIPTLAFCLFVFAGLTDWLDGYLARKLNQVSNFGKLMDALADKIIILGMFIAFLAFDILPKWTVTVVLLIVTRELLITGMRMVAASSGIVLSAEISGKHKTVFQIISIAVLLFSLVIQNDLSTWFGRELSQPAVYCHQAGILLFVFASVLTIYSGVVYLVKYWSIFLGHDIKK